MVRRPKKAPGGCPARGFPPRLSEPHHAEVRITRLVHRADIHPGQPKRYQAAGTADLHHDVLEVVV